jgi:hypothetical protein
VSLLEHSQSLAYAMTATRVLGAERTFYGAMPRMSSNIRETRGTRPGGPDRVALELEPKKIDTGLGASVWVFQAPSVKAGRASSVDDAGATVLA